MINKAGNVVENSLESVVAAQSTVEFDKQFFGDFVDSSDPNAWPMILVAYVALRTDEGI